MRPSYVYMEIICVILSTWMQGQKDLNHYLFSTDKKIIIRVRQFQIIKNRFSSSSENHLSIFFKGKKKWVNEAQYLPAYSSIKATNQNKNKRRSILFSTVHAIRISAPWNTVSS